MNAWSSANLLLGMSPWLIATIVVVGLFLLIILAVLGRFVGLWVQSIVSGAPVGLLDLFMMRLRKVQPAVIVLNRISAKKAGLELATAPLEAHFLAGGNIERVVQAVIAADKAKIELPWDRATAIDLAGRDILEAVRTSVDPKVIDCPSLTSGNTIDAVAGDGIQLKARARVTDGRTSPVSSAARPRRRSSPVSARASSPRSVRRRTTRRCREPRSDLQDRAREGPRLRHRVRDPLDRHRRRRHRREHRAQSRPTRPSRHQAIPGRGRAGRAAAVAGAEPNADAAKNRALVSSRKPTCPRPWRTRSARGTWASWTTTGCRTSSRTPRCGTPSPTTRTGRKADRTSEPIVPLIHVVIPFLDEESTLERVVGRLQECTWPEGWKARMILVDDGSDAAAAEAARSLAGRDGIELLRHDRNRGKGAALAPVIRLVEARRTRTWSASRTPISSTTHGTSRGSSPSSRSRLGRRRLRVDSTQPNARRSGRSTVRQSTADPPLQPLHRTAGLRHGCYKVVRIPTLRSFYPISTRIDSRSNPSWRRRSPGTGRPSRNSPSPTTRDRSPRRRSACRILLGGATIPTVVADPCPNAVDDGLARRRHGPAEHAGRHEAHGPAPRIRDRVVLVALA